MDKPEAGMNTETEKAYTIQQAVDAAKKIVKPLCVNAIKNRDRDEQITLKEYSDLISEMLMETDYHNG